MRGKGYAIPPKSALNLQRRHMRTETLPELALRYLVCPSCHGPFTQEDMAFLRCAACGFFGRIADGVAVMMERAAPTYFDDRHKVMSEGKHDAATWSIFYESQARRVKECIKADSIVLDVGCGPGIPYERVVDFLLIGMDPSYESIRANAAVDIPVYGQSDALPLPARSIDVILCFYSIHHMTGETLFENFMKVDGAFREFSRVIRPGGSVMVFDLSPWWPWAILGNAIWNLARRTIGAKLDMYFWRDSALKRLGQSLFRGATFHIETFRNPLHTTFPPIFSLPALKIPRVLYPFDINLYQWDFPAA